MLTALNRQWLGTWAGSAGSWLSLLLFKIAAVPLSILALFLVYWLLPNRKVPPARVVPAALAVGLILEAMEKLSREITPIDDIRSTREYRARVAGNLLREFLEGFT